LELAVAVPTLEWRARSGWPQVYHVCRCLKELTTPIPVRNAPIITCFKRLENEGSAGEIAVSADEEAPKTKTTNGSSGSKERSGMIRRLSKNARVAVLLSLRGNWGLLASAGCGGGGASGGGPPRSPATTSPRHYASAQPVDKTPVNGEVLLRPEPSQRPATLTLSMTQNRNSRRSCYPAATHFSSMAQRMGVFTKLSAGGWQISNTASGFCFELMRQLLE